MLEGKEWWQLLSGEDEDVHVVRLCVHVYTSVCLLLLHYGRLYVCLCVCVCVCVCVCMCVCVCTCVCVCVRVCVSM